VVRQQGAIGVGRVGLVENRATRGDALPGRVEEPRARRLLRSGAMTSVYAAGPSGFTAAGLAFHTGVVLPALVDAGAVPLDPWDPTAPETLVLAAATGAQLAPALDAVCRRNTVLIDGADAVLAVLDGADVDSGTAAEIGYAYARGLPVVGIRLDLRTTGDPGSTVNGQVEHFITASGGSLHSCPPAELADPRPFLDRTVAVLLAAVSAPR
jgi:nucleoside 2-deoxyribosyltransferase